MVWLLSEERTVLGLAEFQTLRNCVTEIKTEEYNGSEQPNVNKIEH